MASAMGYVAGEVGKDVADGYKAIPRPYKAGDGLGFGLDVTKGVIEGKSFGEAVRDSGTSVWFSKNFGLFIKDENVKRLMSSSMSKVAENIYNTPDKSVKDLKNESK